MTKNDNSAEKQMSMLEHLAELRTRLIYSFLFFIIVFSISLVNFQIGNFHGSISELVYIFLQNPLANIINERGGRMIFTALHEGFFTQIKVGFYFALFISLPLMLVQIWRYISPGLYKDEKNIFLPFMIATPFLFLLSFLMVYFVVMPIAWNFFLSFELPSSSIGLPIEVEPRISEYLSLVLRLILAFGLCFQLPILILLLVRIGIIDVPWLKSKRKYCILFAFITAAILTPPDVISQFLLALPLILLYEVSIIISKFIKKRDSD
tara:strand:+ start:2037 stop:2831 length:795 start_codon:yes stop_codon:yes gene_type:complete